MGFRLAAVRKAKNFSWKQKNEAAGTEQMSVKVDQVACTGCGWCIVSCPQDAVDNRPSFVARIDEDLCTQCLVCLDYCPNGALVER